MISPLVEALTWGDDQPGLEDYSCRKTGQEIVLQGFAR